MYKGIDVSSWQKNIDWNKVKKAGIQFAMLRSSFGWGKDQHDKYFEQNYKGAKSVGIPVGAYHYSYATTPESAIKEADFCYSVIKGKQFEYPIVYDMEESSVSALGKQKVSEIAKAFCERMESYGYYVCIYANKYWLNTYFTDEIFAKYDIWLAEWGDKPTFNKSYGIWQKSSNGLVSGITGRVDLNESYRDYTKIMKNNGLNGFNKSTPVTPSKTETKPVTPKLKKGDKVKVTNPINYDTGKKFKLWHKVYTVLETPKSNRVVIGVDGVVTSAIHVKYLTKV